MNDRIFELEQKIHEQIPSRRSLSTDEVEMRAVQSVTGNAVKANSRSKRKREPDSDRLSSGDDVSLLDQHAGGQFTSFRGQCESLFTDISADMFSTCSALVGRLLELRRQLRQKTPNAKSLSTSIKTICRASIQVLEEGISQANSTAISPGKGNDAISAACNMTERCIPSLLRALHMTQSAKGDIQAAQSGVMELVLLFAKVLDQLHRLILEAVKRAYIGVQRVIRTRPQSHASHDVQPQDVTPPACKQLQRILVQFFHRLAPTMNTQLAEGICCVFFDHVGLLASALVFNASECPPGVRCQGILPPRGLQPVSNTNPDTISQAIAAEVLLLQPLLREVDMVTRTLTEQNSTSNSISTLANFRIKLQHTLLRAIFDDQDETFHLAFTRPEAEEESLVVEAPETCKSHDVKAEFLGKLWDVVGWEILSEDTSHNG